jgi:hypothetical protein
VTFWRATPSRCGLKIVYGFSSGGPRSPSTARLDASIVDKQGNVLDEVVGFAIAPDQREPGRAEQCARARAKQLAEYIRGRIGN